VEQWNFWTVDDGGLRNDLIVTDTLKPGWHHFAVSWGPTPDGQASTKQVYIDGVLRADVSGITLPTFVGEQLEIGRWAAGYGALGAAVDELAAFNRSLTPAEVRQLSEQHDLRSDEHGPLGGATIVADRTVVLDTNAIDRQGGIVSVRLRRDNGPWTEPTPYFDSYRWSIPNALGLHTFAVEYRDRADKTSVVTTTVELGRLPSASASIVSGSALTAQIVVNATGDDDEAVQLAGTSDFDDAVWQSVSGNLLWNWLPDRPQIVYIRFRSKDGLIGLPIPLGPDMQHVYLPLLSRSGP
jgi:hypothetical protein